MRRNSMLRSVIVVSLALIMMMLPLSTLISTTAPAQAETQTSTGPYPGKTQYPWPHFGYDANYTSFSLGPGPKTNHVLWLSSPTRTRFSAAMSVVDGIAYAARGVSGEDRGGIYAFDADTGEIIWQFKPNQPLLTFPNPMVAKVSNTTQRGTGYSADMLIFDGRLYFDGGYTYCLDKWDGTFYWAVPSYAAWHGPVISEGRLITCGYDNVVRSWTLTGTLVWQNNLTEFSQDIMGRITGIPVVVGGRIFLGSCDKYAYCLDETYGDILWTYKTGDIISHCEPSFDDGKVYFGSVDSYFYCLNATDGTLLWRFKEESGTASGTAVAYGNVYFGSYDNNIYCLNKDTGTLVWNYTIGGAVQSSPVVADNIVYGGGGDNYLYAWDAGTGQLIWKYAFPDQLTAQAAVADGKLYVTYGYFTEGGVICFGRGPTETSLAVTSPSMDLEKSTVISGSVMDQSPYTLQRPDIQPPQVINVPVVLGYVKDGASSEIATVTTDSMGRFSYEWTPAAEGTYDLYASFAGDDSYEPSMESVKVQVGPASPTVEEIAEELDVPTVEEIAGEVIDQLPAYSTTDLIIAAVAVVTLCIVLYNLYAIRKLRK